MNETEEFSIIDSIKEFEFGNSNSQDLVKEFDNVIKPEFDKYCKENNLTAEHEKKRKPNIG
mgnify:CR=1 FL=1